MRTRIVENVAINREDHLLPSARQANASRPLAARIKLEAREVQEPPLIVSAQIIWRRRLWCLFYIVVLCIVVFATFCRFLPSKTEGSDELGLPGNELGRSIRPPHALADRGAWETHSSRLGPWHKKSLDLESPNTQNSFLQNSKSQIIADLGAPGWPQAYRMWSKKWSACIMMKVGCTNWLRYIRMATLPADAAEYSNAPERLYDQQNSEAHDLHFVTDEKTAEQWYSHMQRDDVFRFAVVRHPWARLVSAYTNKYWHQCKWDLECMRTQFQVPIPDYKTSLSFHEFVRYLAGIAPDKLNPHFRPMRDVCNLDHFRYDYIADLKNSTQTDVVSFKMISSGISDSFARSTNPHKDGTQLALLAADKGDEIAISSLKCSQETVRLAEKLYKRDADLLGYSFDSIRAICPDLIPSNYEPYWQTRGGYLGPLINRKLNSYPPSIRSSFTQDQVIASLGKEGWPDAYRIWTQKWAACIMPKVGCSNWLRYIRETLLPTIQAAHANEEHLYEATSYEDFDLNFVRDKDSATKWYHHMRKNHVFRFAVVRHPWARLVSVYTNKYFSECKYDLNCMRTMFQVPIPKHKQRMSFHEFVEYVASADRATLNAHFKPMNDICFLDHFSYDFLADLKNKSQTRIVSKKIASDSVRSFRSFAQATHTHKDGTMLLLRTDGDKDPPSIECNADTVKLAEKLYGRDAELLGYSFEKIRERCIAKSTVASKVDRSWETDSRHVGPSINRRPFDFQPQIRSGKTQSQVIADLSEPGWPAAYRMWSKKWSACIMLKIGCTNWLKYIRKQLLPSAIAEYANTYPRLYDRERYEEYSLNFVNDTESADVWYNHMRKGDLFRFVIVRHPWKRLLSGYVNKYYSECQWDLTCMRRMFDLPIPQSKKSMSFHEFVTYLAKLDPAKMNAHFRPMSDVCHLDHFTYDFIADIQNETHTEVVSRKAFPGGQLFAQTFHSHQDGGSSVGEDHPINNFLECNEETVVIAEEIYKRDLDLLGYNFDAARRDCINHGKPM